MIGHSSFLLQIPFSLSYTHFVAFKGGRRRVSSRVQQQALLAVALNGVIKLEGPVESATKSFLVSPSICKHLQFFVVLKSLYKKTPLTQYQF